jgi:chloramphenicol 3-O phosphotransferase
MKPGTIVILNGTSSSGKSTIAKILQPLLPDHFLHLGIDQYMERVPASFDVFSEGGDPADAEGILWIRENGRITGARIGEYGRRVFKGIYSSYAGFSRLGVNIIVDDVIFDRKILEMAARTLAGLPVYFIGVLCPREVAEGREAARGDRVPGLASAFHPFINTPENYDFTVDTSLLTPEEAAGNIHDFLASSAEPQAFREISQSTSPT